EELAAFPEGGYAFVRSPQPSAPGELARSGYLAFSAAYHSRAHKHADDLNVVWFDQGHQILTDAGRFGYGELLDRESPLRAEGYYYAAPERQYVESTMAHNTLMVDGRNQQRQGRKPYGSALTECVQKGARFDLSARVRHSDYVHRLRVVYTPGKELRLLDAIHSSRSEAREGVVWLNLDGSFELESVGEEIVLVAETENGPLRVSVSGPGRRLDPVRGQQEPLRGWRSRKDGSLEPTWSLGFAFPLETRASVETRLRLH
ncbi:MAG: heparinase II/III domain-containing protein, partial [Brachybacterium tyrofermentans]